MPNPQAVFEHYTENTTVFQTDWDICSRSSMQLHFPISPNAILAAGEVGGRILNSLNTLLGDYAESIGFITIDVRTIAFSLVKRVNEKERTYVIEMMIRGLCSGFSNRHTQLDVFHKLPRQERVRYGGLAYTCMQWQ